MGKEYRRYDYDPYAAMQNLPKLLGMELTKRGNGWQGGFYITGEPHPFRRDKLKAFFWKGGIFISEEGGPTMSLANWLIQYGGATDFKDALRMIKGESQALHWNGEFTHVKRAENKHIPLEVLNGAKGFDLSLSPLFRYMCRLFGEERTRFVWDVYNVTATSKGGTCFWYLNPSGQICHDKVVWYGGDAHRIKNLPMGRQYRISDGYTENPMFGSHLQGEVKGILESEKSVLYAACYYGGIWLATGGKSNLRDVGDIPLYADRDAEEAWSHLGTCVDWYSDWPECGDHSDLGDKIEWLVLNNRK